MNKLLMLSIVTSCLLVPLCASAEKVGGGDLTFTPKNALPVVFSHERHVKGAGLKCVRCHYQIFTMAQGSYSMNMEKITKGDFCGKCHDGQKAFDVKDKKNCSRCHR
jgi:c(7)-type cytochrome triheme protein